MYILHTSNRSIIFYVFFFNDTATTEIYTLSLLDALPIYDDMVVFKNDLHLTCSCRRLPESPDLKHSLRGQKPRDRKSTRLNSSHANISYAVFCLKKKKKHKLIKYNIS